MRRIFLFLMRSYLVIFFSVGALLLVVVALGIVSCSGPVRTIVAEEKPAPDGEVVAKVFVQYSGGATVGTVHEVVLVDQTGRKTVRVLEGYELCRLNLKWRSAGNLSIGYQGYRIVEFHSPVHIMGKNYRVSLTDLGERCDANVMQ